MLHNYKEANEYAKRIQDSEKVVKEAKELGIKAKYFIELDQDHSKALKYLESLNPTELTNIYMGVLSS